MCVKPSVVIPDCGRTAMAMLKIVSGGQAGADRAGLDWAITNGIPHGGWCPKGRRSEDGTIPSQYQLQEAPSSNYCLNFGAVGPRTTLGLGASFILPA